MHLTHLSFDHLIIYASIYSSRFRTSKQCIFIGVGREYDYGGCSEFARLSTFVRMRGKRMKRHKRLKIGDSDLQTKDKTNNMNILNDFPIICQNLIVKIKINP